ncbi:MAG: hypothetical protein EPO58_08395 [Chitinophagaceae bacterium]|nr:MAG: hypothetical protein EPO58_08395 [Chitinophagaceae bacterium]
MSIRQNSKKVAFIALLLMGIQVAYAAFSFTGITDEKTRSSKYSFKHLSSLSHKSLSFSSLKSSLQYKGPSTSLTKENGSGSEVSSMLRFDNGNTTYVYPYKFKVKAPKFKTPAPPQN